MWNDRLSGKQVGSQASHLVTRWLAWIQPECGSRTERAKAYANNMDQVQAQQTWGQPVNHIVCYTEF